MKTFPLIFFIFILIGCATTKVKQQTLLKNQVALQVPLFPQRPLYLRWDYKTKAGAPIALPQWGMVFEVWHTTDIKQPFSLWTNVDMPPVIVGGQEQEFFMVRIKDTVTGQVGDWR